MLSRGRLQEEALILFVLVLKKLAKVQQWPVLVSSKTVGKAVGVGDSVEWFAKVALEWRKAWQASELRGVKELVVPVAVDERAQTWYCVTVTSSVDGELLEDAARLRVTRYDSDPLRREEADRIVRNLEALVCGLRDVGGRQRPVVEHASAPVSDSLAQRACAAFGCVVSRVALHAGEGFPDVSRKYFAADFGRILERVFSHLRAELAAHGVGDVSVFRDDASAARELIRMFCVMRDGCVSVVCASHWFRRFWTYFGLNKSAVVQFV